MIDHAQNQQLADGNADAWTSAERAEAAFRSEVATAFLGKSIAPDPLRARVWELTRVLRAMGLPPEAALVRIKATMFTAVATRAPHGSAGGLSPRDGAVLTEKIVTWCIESYFDDSPHLDH
ncbi:MAG: hypothetical protein ABR582_07320 [Gemmatimonadaceae bacterium]